MIKLLVVEDETATRKGLMKHIKWNELGVDAVEEAKDGIEGLEVARGMRPDIVVSDIRMPGMNGIDFTARIREQFPACQIIYLSGHSDKEYLKAAIRMNAVSYVEKPINIDELQEVIRKAVRLCLESNKDHHIRMALSESLPFIRQNIVNGLMRSPIDHGELIRSLHLAGVSFDPGDAYTASIVVPSFAGDETNDEKQRRCSAIVDYLARSANGCTHLAVAQEAGRIVVISAHKPGIRPDFAAHYSLLAAHMSEHHRTGARLSWIVGSTATGWMRICDSYAAAAGFLKQLFYFDAGHLHHAAGAATAVYPINEELIRAYMALIQNPQYDRIVLFTEQLVRSIRTKPATPVDEVKNLFYRMLRMLGEQSQRLGRTASPPDPPHEAYDWMMISNISTLQQLKDYFLTKAGSILQRLETTETNSRAVHDVKKFIRGNFSDKEISVHLLADRVHLTPTYLSSLFRKETGQTISEFITEVRIEKSAALLLEPQAKLYDIADRSGYNDANYFTKAFKKIKGMTPTQFRRRHKS